MREDREQHLRELIASLCRNQLPGDIIECGVYEGASIGIIADTLLKHNSTERTLYLADTFAGMTQPTKEDVTYDGRMPRDNKNGDWCYCPIEKVQERMKEYPNCIYLKGDVRHTLPFPNIPTFALVRLDIDFYESTLHALTHLVPHIHPKGYLIIDDYGHWKGCKQAVHEYFETDNPHMIRIDYSCVVMRPNKEISH